MLIDWLIAAAPIAVVLVLMLRFRWGADRAGLAGWLAALALASIRFGAGLELLALAQGKAVLLAVYVLYIIWMALIFFRVVDEAGAIRSIGAGLPALTRDRGLQALLLAWAFGSFLQGISGYGVPTAVVAPLLIGVGFAAGPAVVIAGIGHAWSVTFGSLAASFLALIAATGRPGPELAPMSVLLLALACFGCGLAVLWAAGGRMAVAQGLGPVLWIGLVMTGTQAGLALIGLYPLASVVAGLAGMLATVLAIRLRNRMAPAPATTEASPQHLPLRLALLPYGLLIAVVGAAEFIPAVQAALDGLVVRVPFPEMSTALGYVTPAQVGRTISVFGHPGALLAYSALAAYALFRWLGRFERGAERRIAQKTVKSALASSVGILTMVAMAVTMEHAGMTRLIADGLGRVTGLAYPLASPFIGALGAFMTGSNTNSNVVFASLQQSAAVLLGLDPRVILAAQTTGGAIGGAFAPAKVIVGCSTVGLAGQEGPVLKATALYGLAILAVVALAAFGLTL